MVSDSCRGSKNHAGEAVSEQLKREPLRTDGKISLYPSSDLPARAKQFDEWLREGGNGEVADLIAEQAQQITRLQKALVVCYGSPASSNPANVSHVAQIATLTANLAQEILALAEARQQIATLTQQQDTAIDRYLETKESMHPGTHKTAG